MPPFFLCQKFFYIFLTFFFLEQFTFWGANSSICLLREVTLQELAVDRAKLEAIPIDDLVGFVCINLIDDIRSLPFGSEFATCLMGYDH